MLPDRFYDNVMAWGKQRGMRDECVCVCVCGFWGVEEYVYRCVYIEVRECGCRVVEEWLRLG